MKDSILKGAGNSRFLKSAVPAGTSWADALAMLQAGTFPVDFNGINTEGFQQIGTPLNKANLLKDATAAQIGLPPSTTPDGMFQALGNTGELHVWRKTVVNSQPQDAYYSLGSIITTSGTIIDLSKQNVNQVGFRLSDSVMVLPDGSVSLVDPKMYYKYTYNDNMYQHRFVASDGTYIIDGNFSGEFISFYADSPSYYGSNYITLNKIYYIPATASFTYGAKLKISQLQPVIGHAAITAGTTTTYPVSTNPNAYQEGEYGKAGYTLGDVKTGTFQIGQDATTIAANRAIIKYGESVSVTDTGTASIASESELTVTSDSSQSAVNKLKGKFFRFSQLPFSSSAFSVGKIYFFPANTVFTKQSSGNWYASKYQTVTSHGKTEPEYTIEYLGKLGNKARVQVVSYVGMGTYGDGNQCSITANFKIKSAIMMYHYIPSAGSIFMISDELSTDYTSAIGFSKDNANYSWGKKSADGKTLFWYGTRSASGQFNESGKTYYVLCIG